MSATARLSLPYIAPLQAQKQYSYNEAMAVLDQLVQPAVLSRTTTAPPASPDEGDAYIVGASATGVWSGKDGNLACWLNGGWSYRAPADGWLAYVTDTAEFAVFQSGNWTSFVTTGGTSLAKLGINATADLSDRLSVAAAGTLLSHDGAGHRLSINKATSADTASLLLKHNFSARAEKLGIDPPEDPAYWFCRIEGFSSDRAGESPWRYELRLRVRRQDGTPDLLTLACPGTP